MRRGGGGGGGGSGYRPLAIPRLAVLRWASLEGARRSPIGGQGSGGVAVVWLRAASAGVGKLF